MIYIVSGWKRCGTSMMMESLMAGGLAAVENPEVDKRINDNTSDLFYRPNDRYHEVKVPLGVDLKAFVLGIDGRLMKIFAPGLKTLPRHDYKVVFMLRDLEEARQSLDAIGIGQSLTVEDIDGILRQGKKVADQRDDMDVMYVNYASVVGKPHIHFEDMAKRGWGINAELAATVPAPEKYRFRREYLSEGL